MVATMLAVTDELPFAWTVWRDEEGWFCRAFGLAYGPFDSEAEAMQLLYVIAGEHEAA